MPKAMLAAGARGTSQSGLICIALETLMLDARDKGGGGIPLEQVQIMIAAILRFCRPEANHEI